MIRKVVATLALCTALTACALVPKTQEQTLFEVDGLYLTANVGMQTYLAVPDHDRSVEQQMKQYDDFAYQQLMSVTQSTVQNAGKVKDPLSLVAAQSAVELYYDYVKNKGAQ